MRRGIFTAVLMATLVLAGGALADVPPGATPLDVTPVVASGGYAALDGGGVTGGCWTVTSRVGQDTSTGTYLLYFKPVWCGNGISITGYDLSRAWPYVSGWYSFDGFDGAWLVGGGWGDSHIMPRAQGRFSWHPPIIGYTSYNTAWITLWLTAGGSAFLYGYQE